MSKNRNIANLGTGFVNISDTGTEGTKVASGTTAQRGSTAGQIRFNTTTNVAEYYDGSGFKVIDTAPSITSIDTTEVDSQAGGNQTFVITGTNFSVGANVTFIGSSVDITPTSVTRDSETQLTVVAPRASFLNAQEPYGVQVINSSGLTNTLANQINVDSSPTWTTASGSLGTAYEDESANITVSASDPDGDTVSYSETASVLSTNGLSLNSTTGVISGNPNDVVSDTTINFTLRATANSKTADRAFSIIIANPPLDGSLSTRANTSATAIKAVDSSVTNGNKWITLDGTPTLVYCDFDGTYSQDASNSYMLYQSYGSNNPLANAINGAQLDSYTALQNKGWSFVGSTFGQNQNATHGGFNHHGASGATGTASLNTLDLKGLTGINKITVWYGGIGYAHTLSINGSSVGTAPANSTIQYHNGSFNPTGSTPYVSMNETTGITASYYIWIANT